MLFEAGRTRSRILDIAEAIWPISRRDRNFLAALLDRGAKQLRFNAKALGTEHLTKRDSVLLAAIMLPKDPSVISYLISKGFSDKHAADCLAAVCQSGASLANEVGASRIAQMAESESIQ